MLNKYIYILHTLLYLYKRAISFQEYCSLRARLYALNEARNARMTLKVGRKVNKKMGLIIICRSF